MQDPLTRFSKNQIFRNLLFAFEMAVLSVIGPKKLAWGHQGLKMWGYFCLKLIIG